MTAREFIGATLFILGFAIIVGIQFTEVAITLPATGGGVMCFIGMWIFES